MEPQDPQLEQDRWEAARRAQRADVQAILARRERLCPHCGAAQRAGGNTCGSCGAQLTARFARWRSLRRFAFTGVALVVAAGTGAALIVPGAQEQAAREREHAAKRQQALEATQRARLIRDARPIRAVGPPLRKDGDPLAHRTVLVQRAEELIAADARKRAAAGTIDGAIEGASCSVHPDIEARRAAEQDPATRLGRYDCVAYTSKLEAPAAEGEKKTALFGYPYWLVIDYRTAKLVWCKVTRGTGEPGSALASIPVPEPCSDPAGPG